MECRKSVSNLIWEQEIDNKLAGAFNPDAFTRLTSIQISFFHLPEWRGLVDCLRAARGLRTLHLTSMGDPERHVFEQIYRGSRWDHLTVVQFVNIGVLDDDLIAFVERHGTLRHLRVNKWPVRVETQRRLRAYRRPPGTTIKPATPAVAMFKKKGHSDVPAQSLADFRSQRLAASFRPSQSTERERVRPLMPERSAQGPAAWPSEAFEAHDNDGSNKSNEEEAPGHCCACRMLGEAPKDPVAETSGLSATLVPRPVSRATSRRRPPAPFHAEARLPEELRSSICHNSEAPRAFYSTVPPAPSRPRSASISKHRTSQPYMVKPRGRRPATSTSRSATFRPSGQQRFWARRQALELISEQQVDGTLASVHDSGVRGFSLPPPPAPSTPSSSSPCLAGHAIAALPLAPLCRRSPTMVDAPEIEAARRGVASQVERTVPCQNTPDKRHFPVVQRAPASKRVVCIAATTAPSPQCFIASRMAALTVSHAA
ncbi:hypothetical protein CSOJ01_11494 [Colletotrichum sojae]|uniref:Uncharacterized protein n=1 Tax=Colletotrichum sojae TaxID=2175907 RepID=A0A8H6MN08_9PEZI|nr:hypothetical protein CSOJ01_11494 [Colletotrichum sojae]